jgi:hypothetical protein
MTSQKAIRWLYAGYTFDQEREWKKKREELRER